MTEAQKRAFVARMAAARKRAAGASPRKGKKTKRASVALARGGTATIRASNPAGAYDEKTLMERIAEPGKAVVGGLLAGGSIAGVQYLTAKYPQQKPLAVGIQVLGAVLLGGGLAAAGFESAGTLVAFTFGLTAAAMAGQQTFATAAKPAQAQRGGAAPQVAGIVERAQLQEQQRIASVVRLHEQAAARV